VLTYAPRPRSAGTAHGQVRSLHPAPAGATNASDATTISRLQSTAGNRAVAQLIAAQREDAKKPATPAAPNAGTKPAGAADKAALRKAWDDAGLVAGGKLFDLVNSDLGMDKLVDMALPGLIGFANEGAAAGFAKGTEDTKGEVKAIGLDKKEAGQITGALTGWAQQGAETWLKSSDGKKFIERAQGFVNNHPKGAYWAIVTALTLGVAGAVTAYFTNNIDPPAFKKKFEAKGLTIDAAVDLGKFQERILQSAKLGLSGKAGPGALGVEGTAKSVTDKRGSGYDLGVTGSYTLGDDKKGASAKLSGGYAYNTLKDAASANLGAHMRYKPLTIDTTFKFQDDGSGVLDTSLVGKLSEDMTLSAGASGGVYGPAESKAPVGYKLALTTAKGKGESDKVTMDMDPKARIVTFGVAETRNLWGGSITASTSQGAGAGGTAGLSFARNALKLDLKYTLDKAGQSALDIGASGKGEGVDAAFAGKFGLETGQLEKLSVHLGFTTPDETLKFLHDLSIELAAGKVDAKATETIKLRLRQIAVEVEGSLGEKDDKATGSARAEVGWKLPSGLIIGAGAQVTNTGGSGKGLSPWMAGPMLSVSHEALPIRLTGGVFAPIDAATATPPVFALGISGNFEFLSGKKK
jgi:hypothetical protein